MVDEKVSVFREHDIDWDDKKVSRLWNYYSRTPPYSEIYFSKLFGHHILRQSGLPLKEPLEVLDFGCGPGFIWDHLRQMGSHWQYTALDFSPDSVKKVLGKAKDNKNFKGAKHVSSLPAELPESYFDIVLLFEVVEHLNDSYLDSTLEEVARLLKRGGMLVITTPNQEDLHKSRKFCPECGAIFHEYQHVRSWNVDSLTDYLKRYKFSLRRAKTLDFTAQGILSKIKLMVRRLLKTNPGSPHLITVFQKD